MSSTQQHSVSKKAGLPPGALIHIGKRKTEHPKVSYLSYNTKTTSEKICETVEDCFHLKDNTKEVAWINIDGLHDTNLIAEIGSHFGLHPLLAESILDTHQRPKTEIYADHLMVSLKMLGLSKKGNSIVSEQISLVLGHNWLLSFQEQEGDIFNPLRMRLKEGKAIVKSKKADYLLYRIIDIVVDNYFFVIEHLSEVLELLENNVLLNSSQELLLELQKTKRQLRGLRKLVAPLREAVSMLQKDSTELMLPENQIYLRDVYEHIIQINETLETQRDIAAGVMDLYLTGVSNKMNKTMQVLTIIATIFIPLTFIAGIYGMNFDHMPELHWKYGYFGVWVVMVIVIVLMLIYFKQKKWL